MDGIQIQHLTYDQTSKVRDYCKTCPSWQEKTRYGITFHTCVKLHTDSSIFLVERCANLQKLLSL